MSKNQQTFVKLPDDGGEIELNYLAENVSHARNKDFVWHLKLWTRQPALVGKIGNGSQLFHGQGFDAKYFDLVQDGWTHDHCLICFRTISENDIAYNDSVNWICKSCYQNFINRKDYQSVLDSLERIKK